MRTSYALATAVALLAVACTKPDFTALQTEANTLLTQYGTQLSELSGKTEALLGRVRALPAETPGVTEANTLLNGARTKLEAVKGVLDGFPAKLAAGIREGKPEGVTSLIATLKSEVGGGLASATAAVTESAGKVEGAEQAAAKAKEAASHFAKQLSTGFGLTGNLEGIESKLVAFIEDAARPVDKTTWFDFDRLTFQTGKAELDLEKSKEQLTNTAELLKAFPALKLKVGGYTDNEGNAAANKKLSLARAKAVVAELTKLGVDAARLDPEGYGAEHPVCAANDTEECRAQNRRIAVRVAAK